MKTGNNYLTKDVTYSLIDMNRLPRHIAIIMDGNGRWAKHRRLPRVMGHRAGVKSVRETVRACGEIGIKVLTLYAFSTENWQRPVMEVNALMSLLAQAIKNETKELMKNNVRLSTIGNIEAFPEKTKKALKFCMDTTKNNTGLNLNLALNYGGRQEILDSVNALLSSNKKHVSEQEFSHYLYTKNLPDPDLFIRTSNEMRISNFLLWQLAYTEMVFTPVFWPAFRKKHLVEAIVEYQKRDRRFGGV